MKYFIIVVVFVSMSCSNSNKSIQGTYSRSRMPEFGYHRRCGQITLFKDLTFEHITCGEIIYPYHSSFKRNGDTIYFKGNQLGLPTNHSKYLVKGRKLYKIEYGNIVDSHWTYIRHSRIPIPLKDK